MGYRRSAQRRDFEAWAAEALNVVSKTSYAEVSAIGVAGYTLCAALVLTHARFENYVKDICAMFLKRINSRRLRSDELPGRLRECALISSLPHDQLKHFYVYRDERLLLDRLHEGFPAQEWRWATNDFKGCVDAKQIIGTDGYPSAENFRKLFFKIGFDNIYADLGRELKRDVEALLESVGGLRCEMAHVGMPPLVSASDIGDKIRQLSDVVACLDQLLYEKLQGFK